MLKQNIKTQGVKDISYQNTDNISKEVENNYKDNTFVWKVMNLSIKLLKYFDKKADNCHGFC